MNHLVRGPGYLPTKPSVGPERLNKVHKALKYFKTYLYLSCFYYLNLLHFTLCHAIQQLYSSADSGILLETISNGMLLLFSGFNKWHLGCFVAVWVMTLLSISKLSLYVTLNKNHLLHKCKEIDTAFSEPCIISINLYV